MNTNTTAKEVIVTLKSLGIEGDIPSIVAISKACRQVFLDHLSAAVTAIDQDTRQRHVLAIKSLLSLATVESLDALRSVLSPAQIGEAKALGAASKVPVRFASALNVAMDDKSERQSAARDFLRQCIDAFEVHSSSQRPTHPFSTSPKPNRPKDDTKKKGFKSAHAYGSSYALCFNAGVWGDEVGIMLDAAVHTGSSYDWNDSIHIWLSPMEIGELLAVFRRWKPRAEIGAHGARNEKTFILEAQEKHYYGKVLIKSSQSSPARGVPITSKDAAAISILIIEQLAAAYPNIPLQEVLATVHATHSLHDPANQRSSFIN